MKSVIEQFAKLIDVKSIVTFLSTFAFIWLALTEKITAQDFMTVFTVIIAFYFGTQAAKSNTKDN